MIAVLFEVQPRAGMATRCIDGTGALRPTLEAGKGFVRVARFESLRRARHFLSLRLWRGSAAGRHWRCQGIHRAVRLEGGGALFAGWRPRVAAVVRAYGLRDRNQAPGDVVAGLP